VALRDVALVGVAGLVGVADFFFGAIVRPASFFFFLENGKKTETANPIS
jgi:hypothetical protein|tara:strand:- start:1331 stop:1477 length:147 start_codon:yes stop_codon:yes gene_type:complete